MSGFQERLIKSLFHKKEKSASKRILQQLINQSSLVGCYKTFLLSLSYFFYKLERVP
jgi:hypothetical protein